MKKGDLVQYNFMDRAGTAIVLEQALPDAGIPSGPVCYRIMTENGHDIVLNVAFMEVLSEARRFSKDQAISR